jgi:hypothetical protein
MLAKTPASSLLIAGLLALGIGATTVMFSLVDEIMLRRLPVSHPEELLRIVSRRPTWISGSPSRLRVPLSGSASVR